MEGCEFGTLECEPPVSAFEALRLKLVGGVVMRVSVCEEGGWG